MKEDQFFALDALKGVSAVMIAYFYHYKNDFSILNGIAFPFDNSSVPFLGGGVKWISSSGFLLVELFFEISGILFVLAYEKKIQTREIIFKNFLKNRILRIYPMMILSTCAMAVLEYIYYGYTGKWWLSPADIWHLFISILGLPVGWFSQEYTVNMPVWYISVLFQCYIAAYFLAKAAGKNGNRSVYAVPVLAALAYDYSAPSFTFGWMNASSSRGFQSFFAGVLLGKYFIKNRSVLEKKKMAVYYGILLLTAVMTACYGEEILGGTAYVLNFIIYPCIIMTALYSRFWNRVCCLWVLQFLGSISYEIYLWNLPAQLLTVIIELAAGIKFPYGEKYFLILHMAASIFAAFLIHKWIELPLTAKIRGLLK